MRILLVYYLRKVFPLSRSSAPPRGSLEGILSINIPLRGFFLPIDVLQLVRRQQKTSRVYPSHRRSLRVLSSTKKKNLLPIKKFQKMFSLERNPFCGRLIMDDLQKDYSSNFLSMAAYLSMISIIENFLDFLSFQGLLLIEDVERNSYLVMIHGRFDVHRLSSDRSSTYDHLQKDSMQKT